MSDVFVAAPALGGLHGRIRVPGDKSISHRALLLAALADGRSRITGLSTGGDVGHTRAAVASYGAQVSVDSDGAVTIEGGRDRLHEPDGIVDVGNSGTGIRLLAGWAANVSGLTVLAGDDSIARRPMDRVAAPLRAMGCRVDGRGDGRFPPLVIRGGGLHGIEYRLPVPSAQVKGAVLLAALGADGPTTVREDLPTRVHTEEMLLQCGADVTRGDGWVTVAPGALEPASFDVPGDPSQAAFWIVAACITPGSDLSVERVYVGPGRAGFLDVLVRMGARVSLEDEDPATSTATVRAVHGPLVGTEVGGAEVPGLIDEIPVLAVAAAHADGVTSFRDAAELKVKESDRVATVVALLEVLGVGAEGRSDGITVRGRGAAATSRHGVAIDSAGDHRIAMAAAVAALAGPADLTISGWNAVATSYPGFAEEYDRCRS